MRARTVLGAIVGATALALAIPTSSFASTTLIGNGFTLSFADYGDVVTICDTEADGYGVQGDVTTSVTHKRVYTFYDEAGSQTCASRGASWNGQYNLVEGDSYTIRACRLDSDFGISSCVQMLVTA